MSESAASALNRYGGMNLALGFANYLSELGLKWAENLELSNSVVFKLYLNFWRLFYKPSESKQIKYVQFGLPWLHRSWEGRGEVSGVAGQTGACSHTRAIFSLPSETPGGSGLLGAKLKNSSNSFQNFIWQVQKWRARCCSLAPWYRSIVFLYIYKENNPNKILKRF